MCSKVVYSLVFLGLFCRLRAFSEVAYDSRFQWLEGADINLGAILSIHSSNSILNCNTTVQDVRNIQTAEALNFAIREINNRDDILTGIKLGFYVLDDCLSTDLALARAIQFMPRDLRENRVAPTSAGVPDKASTNNKLKFYDVLGIIGAYTSKLSMTTASVFNIFNLPQISYMATSNVLSDKTRFPYFFRVVPPDSYQVKTIISVLGRFKWTHVFVVFSEGSYGTPMVKEFENTFQNLESGICIEQKFEIAFASDKTVFRDIAEKLAMSAAETGVVVAFLEINDAKMLATTIQEADMVGKLIWVGSDSLNLILEEFPARCSLFPGSITVRPFSSINDKFKVHMWDLYENGMKRNRTRNPWLSELLTYHHAQTQTVLPKRDNSHEIGPRRPRFIDSFIIDSVYAFGHALDNVIKRRCPDYLFNTSGISDCISRADVYTELKTLTFNGSSGLVAFNKDGDVMTKYEVFQCQESSVNHEMMSVGFWHMGNESLDLDFDSLIWKPDLIPFSACPNPCSHTLGSIYYFSRQTCCHGCVQCKANEIVAENTTRCDICPEFYWPDESRSTCFEIPPYSLGPFDTVSISLITIGFIGFITCTVVALIMTKYRNEYVIKCFSLELSGIILFGTIMAFCLTGIFLTETNSVKCFVNHIGFNLTFTVIYAPLLMKTNRIYRIFNAGKKTTKRPGLISNGCQVLVSALLIAIQVVIVVISTTLESPEAALRMPSRTEKYVELVCNLPHNGLLTSLSYNLVLVALCTFYAFKTRQLPNNYKESRYIAFCVITTLLIWITFIPTYLTTSRAVAKTTILAVSLLLHAYVTVLCLFIPRVYTLYQVLKDQKEEKGHSFMNVRVVKHVVVRKQTNDFRRENSCSGFDSSRRDTWMDMADDGLNVTEQSNTDVDMTDKQQSRAGNTNVNNMMTSNNVTADKKSDTSVVLH